MSYVEFPGRLMLGGTEFQWDGLVEIISKHWPERGDGWQFRVADLIKEIDESGIFDYDEDGVDW